MTKVSLKRCFKCAADKPRAEFYAHPKMADGLLGKCKVCARLDMKRYRRSNPIVQEREQKRAKLPHRRKKSRALAAQWNKNNPEKYKAKTALNNAIRDGRLTRGICDTCSSNKNVFGIHPDPARLLVVIWRCAKCHHRSRYEAAE